MTDAVAMLVHVMIENTLRILRKMYPVPFREALKLNMMDGAC